MTVLMNIPFGREYTQKKVLNYDLGQLNLNV